MPEFDKLNEYLDESALRKQTDFILGLFKEVESGGTKVAESFKNISFKIENKGTGTKELLDDVKKLELTSANYQKILTSLSAEVSNLTEEQKKNLKVVQDQYKAEETARAGAKETVNLLKTEISQTAKLDAGKSALAKTIALNNQQLKAEKLERDRLAKVLSAENNSREKAQAIIDLLINKGKKLNLETEQGRRVNESYNKKILEQTEFLKKFGDVESNRIKNIGNYSKSAQIIVEALEKEKRNLKSWKKPG
ncbi:MAG: hypothetical protein IPJ81_18010 [Chitinophagaceae bacterium]|nr:hypothetical protein [Chitinophagaceae bacterium]